MTLIRWQGDGGLSEWVMTSQGNGVEGGGRVYRIPSVRVGLWGEIEGVRSFKGEVSPKCPLNFLALNVHFFSA